MRNTIEVEQIKFSWAKLAAICFAAGGLYALVHFNSANITKLESKFTQSLNSQVASNARLNDSITTLNLTMVRLEESLKNKDKEMELIKTTLQSHDKQITMNHDDILKIQSK